jgi:hypothetical protein
VATKLPDSDNRSRDDSPDSRASAAVSPRAVPGARGRFMRRSGPVCRQVANLLGVYVLGGLRGQQEAWVTAHLSSCVRCRAEYEELAEVPVFLDLITAEEAAAAERPPGQAPVAHEKVRKSTEQEAFGSPEVRLPRRQVPPAG